MKFDPSGCDILRFAREHLRSGRRVAFATLVGIDGSSPRSPGAQIAVCETGASVGSISSGCLERAIIAEALASITRGEGALERYGKGSRFVDVVLPCGSGVDILYTVDPSPDEIEASIGRLDARRDAVLRLSKRGFASDGFEKFTGPIRIIAAGFGPELTVFAALGEAAGYEICAMSPDEATLEACVAAEKILLHSSDTFGEPVIDARSAAVLLFHDREWERALAPRFLRSPAFFVGAVGGSKTAAARCVMLRDEGVDEDAIARLSAPVGLVPMTRDPSALSISILAEIVANAPPP
ncbi:MAG: XdhC family protein [Parvularculaceae bacterium]